MCTLSMLCSSRLRENLMPGRCITRLLVDEASQVYVGGYLVHLALLPSLRYKCRGAVVRAPYYSS